MPSMDPLTEQSGDPNVDDRLTDALVDAIASNDKVIEVRPAEQSRGPGLAGLLVLAVGAAGLAYWVLNSRTSDDLLETAKEETADRTRRATEGAAEAIDEGSETAADRIEAGSQRAGDAVEEAGETAADRTEEAGDAAADEADDTAGDRFSS